MKMRLSPQTIESLRTKRINEEYEKLPNLMEWN